MGRTTNASKKAATAAKISAQAVKKATLNEMSKAIHQTALENDGKLPYGFMLSFVEENKKSCSWVTRDSLNSTYTRYKKSIVLDPESNCGQGRSAWMVRQENHLFLTSVTLKCLDEG